MPTYSLYSYLRDYHLRNTTFLSSRSARYPSSHLRLTFVCWLLITAGNLMVVACASSAQTAHEGFAIYDVTSVKPHKGGETGMSTRTSAGMLTMTNITLTELVMNAYATRQSCVFGTPPWAGQLRWDVVAKASAPPTAIKGSSLEQQTSEDSFHLQQLLSERFGLTTHFEERVLPVFGLAPIKSGVRIHKSTALPEQQGIWARKPNEISASGISFKDLAEIITYDVGRTVIDETGMPGKYDFDLKWSSEEEPSDSERIARPTIITALQDQLGLKLVTTKGPVRTLIIDSVHMPTAN